MIYKLVFEVTYLFDSVQVMLQTELLFELISWEVDFVRADLVGMNPFSSLSVSPM